MLEDVKPAVEGGMATLTTLERVRPVVEGLYGVVREGAWYRARVERLWQGKAASDALVRMVDFGWSCVVSIAR